LIFWGIIFALGAGLNIVLGWHGWPSVLSGNLADSDSYMRLVRIEDGLAQGRLLNAAPRDQSGAGVLLEWSHLLDMMLIATAAPLAVLIGWKSALFAASVAAGPLTAGVQTVALAYTARPFAEDRLLWTAAIAAGLSSSLHLLSHPGAVGDSSLTLVFSSLSIGCVIRAWRGGIGHAFLGGMSGGLAVWLTPEILPLVMFGFLPIFLSWLQRPRGAIVAACTAGFFDVIGFAFAIDPPKGGYFVADPHRLSLVYAVLAMLLLLAGTTIWRLQDWRHERWRKPAGIALIASILVVWAALFPQTIVAGVEFVVKSQSVNGLGATVQLLSGSVFAFCYALWRAFSGRSWNWLFFAIIALAGTVVGARLAIYAAAVAAAGAALLPVFLSEMNRSLRSKGTAAVITRWAALAAIVFLPYLPVLAQSAQPSPLTPVKSSCSLRHIKLLTGNDKEKIVLAMPGETPELLYRTSGKTVGSLYLDGLAGYQRARAAWLSPPASQEPDAVRATGASLVLHCSLAERDPMIAGLPGGTLWDELHAATIPPWLVLQAQDPASGWQLFAIR
jgi:hypothetical protein